MNNHRHLTNINTITSLLELIFYVTKTSLKTRKLTEGVSETDKRLETHMALPKIAKDWTSAGMQALMAASITLGGSQFAHAQDKVANAQQGKPVILRVGAGFKEVSGVESTQRILNAKGCPTTVTTERGFPKNLTVEVDGNKFRTKSVGSAGAAAQQWCLADLNKS